MEKQFIYNLDAEELGAALEELGEPSFRVKQLHQGLYNKLYVDFDQFCNIPKTLRQKLDEKFSLEPVQLETRQVSRDKTTDKALFRLHDGHMIETVLMRFERRNTLCISTQVGCPMGCVFCSTGQMGYDRNLSVAEILGQIIYFQREMQATGEAVRNLVFMGMGEPFLNYENVSKSLRFISDPEKLGIGQRHVTVSTVGVISRIMQFAKDHPQVNLAISLHAPNDELRTRLVPANRIYPLKKLMETCRAYVAETNRKLTIEYALVDNLNDTPELAHEFARLVSGMLCIVNLITLNPSKAYATPGSPHDRVQAFREILVSHGVRVTVRLRRGIDIQAGCGQLASSQDPQ